QRRDDWGDDAGELWVHVVLLGAAGSGSGCRQCQVCPPVPVSGGGNAAAQSSRADRPRVRNGQPLGGCVADGTGPVSTIRSGRVSRLGVAANSARVYGCRGVAATSAAGPCSTSRPR